MGIALDAMVVLFGMLLGGKFGLCTICTILLSGVMIQKTLQLLHRYLVHKRKEIVDPWISLETHYDGTPWPDHNNPEHSVNPFELFKILDGRTETIETVPAKYQDLTFQKLFGYYGSKGIVLNQKTFIKNLGLKTEEGEFNILAQLLSDNSHFPLRVSIFDGETKGSNLFSVREFGNEFKSD